MMRLSSLPAIKVLVLSQTYIYNFYLLQDLNNKILLNAVKGMKGFTTGLFSQQFTSFFSDLIIE